MNPELKARIESELVRGVFAWLTPEEFRAQEPKPTLSRGGTQRGGWLDEMGLEGGYNTMRRKFWVRVKPK